MKLWKGFLKTAIKLQHFGDGRFIDSGLKEWKISTGQTGNQPRLFNRDAWLFGLDQTGGNCHNRTVPTTTWGFCIWVMSINRYNLYVKDIYLAVIQMLMRCSWNGHEPHKKMLAWVCWMELSKCSQEFSRHVFGKFPTKLIQPWGWVFLWGMSELGKTLVSCQRSNF